MNISCIVDVASREVSFQDTYRIASYDHNVDVIHFSVEPIEDFSLDTSSIRIAAQGPNKARHDYTVDPSTVQIEEETGYITFDWPIPAGVTEMPLDVFKYGDKGQLIFAVCAEIIDGSTVSKAWHSDDGIITVVAHLEPESGGGEDPEEEATNAQKIAQLQTNVAVMGTQIGALTNGSPAPVATVAEMTDESAVYLYTGSETGYTAGNWYYYNGSAWTSGGTYGGAVTDTTLTMGGRPADSKVTGVLIAETKEDLQTSIDVVVDTETVTTWESYDKDSEELTQIPGYINSGGGMSGTTSSLHKTWYFTADEDMDVYATRTNVAGQLRIGIYNDTQIVAGNIIHYGATNAAGTMPTEENPFHVEAGQCVVVSHYNPSEYDFVLHYSVANTNRVFRQTLGLTEQMGIEVDEKIAGSAPDVSNQIKSKIADASVLSTDALLYEAQLPSYYTTPEENPASFDEAYSYMERRIRAIPDVSKSFVFIADTHWTGNTKHSTQMINYIRKRTGIRKVLFGGDIKGNATDKYLFVRDGGDYLFESRQAFGTDYIPCVGDHDHNTVNVAHDAEHFVPYMEVHEMFMGDVKRIYHCYDPVEKLAEFTTDPYQTLECLAFFHTVYYVDDVERNIRFIVLNCGNAGNYGAMYDVFGASGTELLRLQFDFLAETLMSTPEGMNVCVLSHKLSQGSSSPDAALRILSTFARHGTTSPKPATSTEEIERWWNHATATYNFANAPNVGFIFCLDGHLHSDRLKWFGLDSGGTYQTNVAYDGETVLNQRTSGQIPCIITATDGIGTVGEYAQEMVSGTVTEQCFDVVTIEDDGIAFTRFGVGSDRKVFVEVGSNE